MDKRELILDSIKKLISLGVSDDEIVSSIVDVGVERKEAIGLTKEARSGTSSPPPLGQLKIEEYVPVQPQPSSAFPKTIPEEPKFEIPKEGGTKDVFDEITEQLNLAQQNVVRAEQSAQAPPEPQNIGAAGKAQSDEEEKEIEPSDIDIGMKFEDIEEKPETEESLEAQAVSLNEEIDLAKKAHEAAEAEEGGVMGEKEGVESDALNALRRLAKTPKQMREAGELKEMTGAREMVRPLFSTAKPGEGEAEEGNTPEESENLIVNKIISEVASGTSKKDVQKALPVVQPKQSDSQKVMPLEVPQAAQLKPQVPQKTASERPSKPVPVKKKSSLDSVSDLDIEQLWKKGIVTAINAKLSEMKKIKNSVDSVVQQKVDAAVRKETDKFKVLLDSQKELIISSNQEALEEKLREIAFIIDSKIAELKHYNTDLKANLDLLEKTKQERNDALVQLTAAIDEVRRTKVEMISETNSELIRIKSQTQEFIDAADAHLKEMDDRIAKTLELEKNIAEGMLQEAEQRIDELAMQKAQGLLEEMEVELNKIRAAEKQLSLDTLKQKIEILDEFKKQFLQNMEATIAKMNESINRLDQKNADAERQLKERTLIFDAKIENLEKFEKEFAGYIQQLLDKK